MTPVQKRTRGKNVVCKPFPTKVAVGYFSGFDVEIFDESSIKTLTETTYGVNPKPRQMLSFNDKFNQSTEVEPTELKGTDAEQSTVLGKKTVSHSLVLFLEEAFFLHHQIKCLEIYDLDDKIIPSEELWRKFCNLKESFVESYVSYLYLKSKNWVVKSGIRFGGDFLLYKQSPQLFHGSFIVIISRDGKTCLEYHTNERIAETTGKNLVYLEVFFPVDVTAPEYLNNLQRFTVKELMIRRNEMRNKVS